MAKKSKKATVFATESILAVLMASVRSVYGWDMTITKQGNNLFLDKRDGGIFDLISVNENATDAPTDDEKSINSALALSMEATYVNRSYASQVLSASETVQFPQGNPLAAQAASGQVPPAVYRYRKWDLGSDVDLIVRTRLDAALQQQGESELSSSFKSSHSPAETQFLTLRTLLEYDSRVANTPDWRQKLDSMKGAVLATEFKNNSFKLSRWVIESVLSGADQLRIGFVSRLSPKDRKRHTLLGTGVFKPFDFLAQLNFDIFSGWGIVKTLVTMLMENHPDGKYVLMKDPNKPQLLLYAVPASSEPTEA
jgi:translation initiation factor 3 subunit D